jgi:hypothetical protein
MQKACAESYPKWKAFIKESFAEYKRLGEVTFPRNCVIAGKEVPTATVLNLLVDSAESCPGDEEEVSAVLALPVCWSPAAGPLEQQAAVLLTDWLSLQEFIRRIKALLGGSPEEQAANAATLQTQLIPVGDHWGLAFERPLCMRAVQAMIDKRRATAAAAAGSAAAAAGSAAAAAAAPGSAAGQAADAGGCPV